MKTAPSAWPLRLGCVISMLLVLMMTEEEQLSFAATEGRALSTFNTPDYLRLCLAWLGCGKEHAGIVVSDQLPIGETVRRLLNLLNWVPADEMRTEIRWRQGFK